MSNEFRPRYPLVTVVFFLALMFGFVSGFKALVTMDHCDGYYRGVKHWRVFPPEWVCGR